MWGSQRVEEIAHGITLRDVGPVVQSPVSAFDTKFKVAIRTMKPRDCAKALTSWREQLEDACIRHGLSAVYRQPRPTIQDVVMQFVHIDTKNENDERCVKL